MGQIQFLVRVFYLNFPYIILWKHDINIFLITFLNIFFLKPAVFVQIKYILCDHYNKENGTILRNEIIIVDIFIQIIIVIIIYFII